VLMVIFTTIVIQRQHLLAEYPKQDLTR
jgi:hypothetical protein